MSFPRYSAYKDSCSPWLGRIPAHWKVVSMRWITSRYSGGTPDKTIERYWTDGTIPWLNSGAVNSPLITEPSAFITDEAFDNSSAKWIPDGALVVALAGQGKTKGMVAQLGIPATSNQSMAAIVPTQEIQSRFLFWWLKSNYQNIRNMAGGDLRDGLNLDLLGTIPCPLLPVDEQLAIADFLDRETAKIDALVAEQEKLIVLLKEKCQAVISQAVTKGLNPTVPMKDSGVEWLGKVPAHWAIKSLRYLATIATGSSDTADATDDGEFPFFVRSESVERIGTYSFDCEAVLTAGDGAGVGKVFHHFEGKFEAHQRVYVLHGFQELSGRFIYFYLRENFHRVALEGGAKSTVDSLRRPMFTSFPMMVPPANQQKEIIEFVQREEEKFLSLTDKAKESIKLLQERRSALISAAVTGQINVCGFGQRAETT